MSPLETPDEYRDEAVNRILAAKDGPNDPTAPTDPAKFIEWLHGPETKVEPHVHRWTSKKPDAFCEDCLAERYPIENPPDA